MAKTKITTPVPGFNGNGPGGLIFEDGVAYTDDEAIINYCSGAGYGVGKDKPIDPPGNKTTPEVDARDVPDVTPVGTRVRDAAVDPRDSDFLPPINAGKADPHGPDVVAPGLHAVPPAPIVPGDVPHDPAAQQAKESDAAEAVLIDQQPPHEVVGSDEGPAGPLDLSDVGSVEQGVEGAEAVQEAEQEQRAAAVEATRETAGEPPAASASKAEWVAYAQRRGMSEQAANALSRNELRDTYTK